MARQSYPPYTVLQYILHRAVDGDLPVRERVESLRLADHLGSEDPQVRAVIASIMSEPKTPIQLHRAALAYLMNRNYPDLAGHLMKAWPTLSTDKQLLNSALTWLTNHPDPRVLAEVVKLWARQRKVTGPDESRFRLLVEKMSKKPWHEALLDGLNASAFFARGSAVEVLARRLTEDEFHMRLSRITPNTRAMSALRMFSDRFAYLPKNRSELLSMVIVSQSKPYVLNDTELLSEKWRKDENYRFNIRDFHLLSNLARDGLRKQYAREQLIGKISRSLLSRKHALNGRIARAGNFGLVSHKLSLADMWNVYLLSEMLARPRVQTQIGITAAGDRIDRQSQWGGLIVYKNGRAEAHLYRPGRKADDQDYISSKELARKSRFSLCRFVGHFEKLENVSRAGPTMAEMMDARNKNYNGLVLTTISGNLFAAHYYNPAGRIVSLGLFPYSTN